MKSKNFSEVSFNTNEYLESNQKDDCPYPTMQWD